MTPREARQRQLYAELMGRLPDEQPPASSEPARQLLLFDVPSEQQPSKAVRRRARYEELMGRGPLHEDTDSRNATQRARKTPS
jgi:hypothetical protein